VLLKHCYFVISISVDSVVKASDLGLILAETYMRRW